MDDFDRFLKKYESEGFQFQSKEVDWGTRYIGTKKPGDSASLSGFIAKALGLPHKVMVGHFPEANPSAEEFQAFLADAEKFYDDAGESNTIDSIVVVTPQKLDKKSVSYLLEHSDDDVVKLLEYKTVGPRKGSGASAPAPTSTPTPPPPVVSATSVPSQLLDIATLQSALISPSEKERVLYAWEVFPEKTMGTGQTILLATQERGILMRRVGSDHVTDVSFKWEDLPGEPRVEVDSGGPSFSIFDGTRAHRLRHKDAEFIGSLIHHLKWSREGFISGHMRDNGFDGELVSRCAKDFAESHFEEAVRSGFVILESRLRRESMARANVGGKELVEHAFNAQEGRIPVGVDPSEKEGVYFLFRGAFQAFRNPVTHRPDLEDLHRAEALSRLALINLLLDLTRRGKEQFERGIG